MGAMSKKNRENKQDSYLDLMVHSGLYAYCIGEVEATTTACTTWLWDEGWGGSVCDLSGLGGSQRHLYLF